ncbi:hypothetical protein HHK36_029949 [Tetracentron sinense]|uniref:Serine/threonine-protein kinase 11-interacting protein n=1 Tax=Tetracentron sinense TaxID=13715 RepID=A0A834YES6_TETSI|nr:hypothetical protein HHK36_029949 [Tetracentron sinense]
MFSTRNPNMESKCLQKQAINFKRMAIVTGDRYLDFLVKFVEKQAGPLLEGSLVLKLNPVGLHYVQSRLEALQELEGLLAGAPVDYLRAYISDLGDHRALEQLRRILRLLTSLKVVSVFPPPSRDLTPLSLLPFGRLKVLELRGCDLSTSGARGLLELRHTLEKIICHNSTDALRHVFASRIADIKDCPVWNWLSFVSCACNGLVLMDESLQLLPVVETLDLSRNRFAKVDNLRKCTKLRHLDLGFNHLRTIASFSEVSCPIVKLVLRNNPLTTLRGIENLKSVEGLDLSYNIISNFSELEILASLPSLQSLWLEGNPICCARWYRAQVFSFFTHPEKLKLDEKVISTRETWKRQIILASRQKRPAGFGFYSPVRDDPEGEGSFNMKRMLVLLQKKLSRLACIENEEHRRYISSESVDQESMSCDSEIRSREDNVISDGEAEIVGLMNRVEFMKKERSVHWLREFKEWMDHTSENMVDNGKFNGPILSPGTENYMKNKKSQKHLEESSKYVSDSVQASGDESSTNMLESENSFADTSIGFHAHQYFDSMGEAASGPSLVDSGGEAVRILKFGGMDLKQEQRKAYLHEEVNYLPVKANDSLLDTLPVQGGDKTDSKVNITPLAVIDEIMESHSSSACPGSPPHYQEDILHRRHNLEEEFMQLSAESFSVASSDSDTSYSEDDFCKFGTSLLDVDQLLSEESLTGSLDEHSDTLIFDDDYYGKGYEDPDIRKNNRSWLDFSADRASSTMQLLKPDHAQQLCSDGVPAGAVAGDIDHIMNEEADCLDKRKCRRKPKRRVISLSEANYVVPNTELLSEKLNGIPDVCKSQMEDGPGNQIIGRSEFQKSHDVSDMKHTWINSIRTPPVDGPGRPLFRTKCASFETDEFIKNYFHSKVADSRAYETCLQYMRCHCILEQESGYGEREVAIILSSEKKLYTLLIDVSSDGSETISRIMGCHRLEDVREIVVGFGVQILSLEQVQVELFEKHICGGLRMNIFQYSMLLFWRSIGEEEFWLSRSLFVIEGHMLICIEDLMQFSSLKVDDASSSSYFLLDSCCFISDISEMIIEANESGSVTLILDHVTSEFCSSAELGKEKVAPGSLTWKFKWVSEETLLKFVAVLKALHAGTTMSPLAVRYIS